MTIQRFGSVAGEDVFEVTLENDGVEARILTWGAVLRDLIVPAPRGPQRVVLGLNSIEDYLAHSPYFGAIVGRYANRIGKAQFMLDGTVHRLVANDGLHQLHGGPKGFGNRIWSVIDRTRSSVTLSLVSEHGDMGYPGRLVATCTYALIAPATLRISLEATSDRPTPVNLSTHGYFNLDGSADIASHRLTITADEMTLTDPDLIPTGEIASVDGTPYDFRKLRPVDSSVPYDINYVLRRSGELSHAATLQSPVSGLSMELWTTEPGLQFYDGHKIRVPVPGLAGASYGPRAGLCLEPQRFPDGPNKAHFPASILQPGTVSLQLSELRFAEI
ncbi:aldose epimerase family protein [Microvirga flavescens]|uniref:aldose epimerase family protein n=1 Tax=Microvirga flavescens TaxID=2249811 RepID=UPI000DDBA0FA|nr:aldose epimerase family protein [Microvirga flavescens]